MSIHVPAWARRGTEVVCIATDWDDVGILTPAREPLLNEVLTIAKVTVCDEPTSFGHWQFQPGVFLTFDEIPEQYTVKVGLASLTCFCRWRSTNFRPLIRNKRSRRADVGLFNPNPNPIKIREDA